MHVIACNYKQLHALHAITCNYTFWELDPFLFSPWIGHNNPLTFQYCTANMLNTHEDLRSRPGTWMVAGFYPHIDKAIAKYPKEGGNSASVRNVELMAQCSKCLFQGWNETYTDPVPMEFADGKTRLTHVVAALSISDQQEAVTRILPWRKM